MAINKAKMKCNAPKRKVQGGKKFVVKACKDGKEKIIRYGAENMKLKKSNTAARRNFKDRQNLSTETNKNTKTY